MLKYALLAGVMTIAAPALAQTQTNTVPQTTTAPAQVPDGSPVTDPQASPATPMDSAPVTTTDGTAMQSAATDPAEGGDQVATVVQTEFPTYDANKDGKLEKTEFASWMVKLKQASDPKASATSAETRSWVNAAFAQADKDKDKSVTQPELVGFLSQGQS
ncbi:MULTISPECIES: EF-hand domain-containing protein [unclassified Sphingomonas]|jgi:hypothetical protein|uniref:EF-hand domain-containing protein n=1 Tax=unclassified Sphingomonas TaxID=196159 RepID=UPI0025CBC98E|nr:MULTISPECIES: EF-hand domain-containing protein [unclassified Sphingomonas]